MVRNAEAWSLAEPELNNDGQPAIHSIAELLGCIRTGMLEQPSHCIVPEEQVAKVARSETGGSMVGAGEESYVDAPEEVSSDAMASFDHTSVSTSASVLASPHESSWEIKHDNSLVCQNDTGDYAIGQQAPEISHQLYFNYQQLNHGIPREAAILPLTGNSLEATAVQAGNAAISCGNEHPVLSALDMSMMEVSDIWAYLIPAWNDIRDN